MGATMSSNMLSSERTWSEMARVVRRAPAAFGAQERVGLSYSRGRFGSLTTMRRQRFSLRTVSASVPSTGYW